MFNRLNKQTFTSESNVDQFVRQRKRENKSEIEQRKEKKRKEKRNLTKLTFVQMNSYVAKHIFFFPILIV